MNVLSHQFNLLKRLEFDWDDENITAQGVAVKLAIVKEQNRVAFKMADFYLTGEKTGSKSGDDGLLQIGLKKFVGSKRLVLKSPKELYDRTASRGHDDKNEE